MMPRLYITSPHGSFYFDLPLVPGAEVYIGSAPHCQLILPGLAPVHARIICRGREYVIEDMGSPVGTFANGAPVRSVFLMPRVEYRMGATALTLIMGAAAAVPPQSVVVQPVVQYAAAQPQAQPSAPQKEAQLEDLSERELDVLASRMHTWSPRSHSLFVSLGVTLVIIGAVGYGVYMFAENMHNSPSRSVAVQKSNAEQGNRESQPQQTIEQPQAAREATQTAAPVRTAMGVRYPQASQRPAENAPAQRAGGATLQGVQTAMGVRYSYTERQETADDAPAAKIVPLAEVLPQLGFIGQKPDLKAAYYIYLNMDQGCSNCMHFFPLIAEEYAKMRRKGVEVIYIHHEGSKQVATELMKRFKAKFPCVPVEDEHLGQLPHQSEAPRRHAAIVRADGELVTGLEIGSVLDWQNIIYPQNTSKKLQDGLSQLKPLGKKIDRKAKGYIYYFPDWWAEEGETVNALERLAQAAPKMRQAGLEPIMFIPHSNKKCLQEYQRYKNAFVAVSENYLRGTKNLPGYLYRRNTVVDANGRVVDSSRAIDSLDWQKAAQKLEPRK